MDLPRHRSLSAWLAWQEGLNPRGIELGLERVRTVWRALGAPRLAGVVFTVGGTNGKGSVVTYLDAMLRAGGYRTGRYTSPHLERYNERVSLGGVDVTDQALCDAFSAVDAARGEVPLTYFEFGTLAAFWLFARADLDAAVLEVGLGGRLDAVNLVDPDVAVVTSVDLDHQDWLGDDREAIGFEKAGIFRAGRPAICGDPNPPARLLERAAAIGAELARIGRDYRAVVDGEQWDFVSSGHRRLALPLPGLRGAHQLQNAATAVAALQAALPRLPLPQQAIREGLLSARLPGRMELVGRDPAWLLDVAHNPHAAKALARTLGDQFVAGRTHAVLAMLQDKDAAGVVAALANRVDCWWLAGLDGARGQTSGALRACLPAALDCRCHDTVAEAMGAVAKTTGAGDRVVVLGSFFTVGEARRWLHVNYPDIPL